MLRPSVTLRHAEVGLERLVRGEQTVVELVALEHVVVAPRLVAGAMLRIHRTAHRPQRALLALDPDHDRLLRPRVVDAVNDPFGEAALRRFPPHGARIQSPRWSDSRACCAPHSRFCSLARAPRTASPRMSSASTAAAAGSPRSSRTVMCRTG